MKCLTFERTAVLEGVRPFRAARFEERSMLPVSAACLVANATREALAALYGEPLHLRVFEPVIPAPEAWKAIGNDALFYRVRGKHNDATIVLRPVDALSLAGLAFREAGMASRALSRLERRVLDRAAGIIATACAPVCGVRDPQPPDPVPGIDGCVTFFEMQIERPVCARIGIALSREPLAEARGSLTIEDLLDVQIELTVETAAARLKASDLALLGAGALVPMTERRALRGALYAAGRPLASGECGVMNGRFALAVDVHEHDEGGTGTAA